MKCITEIEEISVNDFCLKVKEEEEYRKDHKESEGLPFLYVNLRDLENDSEYIRLVGIFDKEKDDTLIWFFGAKKSPDDFDISEWIPFNSLSYDHQGGLRW